MVEIRQIPLGQLQTNCYFLGCETTKKAAIIDPGWSGAELANYVAESGYEITHILLTHTHFDHIGGLAELKTATNVPIYAHAESIPMLQNGAVSAQRWGIEMPQPPDADEMIVEGDVIEVGALKLEVLFTPGHAPGHVCFYLRDEDVLFSGDLLFQGSIGRTDLPGGDLALLMRMITEKVLPLPDETNILSGHGAATTLGVERQHNPFIA